MIVSLVGAGPGAADLITIRGARALQHADVVAFDRLINDELLDLAPAHAERISVGKAPGESVNQAQISALLVDRARKGLRVVRLKGGDPFVFGRGGEEAIALANAGIPFEVIPGISSALAVPASAGIPVTHRGTSAAFTVVTGHDERATIDAVVDWNALARLGGTIVVLMGVRTRGEIAHRLMTGGLDPMTPVAAVHKGTTIEQRVVRGRLSQLADLDIAAPATIVIGEVAAFSLTNDHGAADMITTLQGLSA